MGTSNCAGAPEIQTGIDEGAISYMRFEGF